MRPLLLLQARGARVSSALSRQILAHSQDQTIAPPEDTAPLVVQEGHSAFPTLFRDIDHAIKERKDCHTSPLVS